MAGNILAKDDAQILGQVFTQVFTQHKAAFESLQASLAQAFKPLGQALTPVPSADEINEVVSDLANELWCIPANETMGFLFAAHRVLTNQEKALDKWMVEYFSPAGEGGYRGLKTSILNERTHKELEPLLKETMTAYENGLLHLATVGACATIEGLIAARFGKVKRIKTEEVIEKEWSPREKSFEYLCRLSLLEFTKKLFEYRNFAGSRPNLNRHWLLHGRAVSGRAEVALRLLLAISCIQLIPSPPKR